MNKTTHIDKYIANYFGIGTPADGNISIPCPFHEDKDPSAGINFKKKLFNCFRCGGLNFVQLYKQLKQLREDKLINENLTKKVKPKCPQLSEVDFEKRAIVYLKERGLDPKKIPIFFQGCDDYTIDGRKNPFYGYLIFESTDGYLCGRDLVGEDEVEENIRLGRPRYMNEPNPKGLFWLSKNEEEKVIFLVEGIFDGLSLYQLGIENIAVLGGSNIEKKHADDLAHSFRNKTVLVLLDNDPAGFKGSKKISDKLKEYEVDHHILEIPDNLGKDVNELLVNHPEKLDVWLSNVIDRFDPDDVKYVDRLFRGQMKPLNILPTGIPAIDQILTGGFKDGGHVISGQTGIGKTGIIFNLAINGVEVHNKRVMINSCEISKKQSYARIGSYYSDYTWEELEEDPTIIEAQALQKVKEISKNILVVNGWPLQRIIQESKHFDVIIIDYLQRVREAYSGDQNTTRHLINNYVSRMTDLGALQGKICLMVSALDRGSYNKPDSYGLKESGTIEYMGTTVSRLIPLGDPADGVFYWKVQKNNRGAKGTVKLRGVNLGHCDLRNCKAERMGTGD